MKGVEALAEIVSLLVMFGLSAVLGGLIIITLNYVTILKASPIDVTAEYTMSLNPIYPPIKMEDFLLAYLESTEETSGIQFKKIITYAAYQENVTNVFVDEKGIKEIDLVASSSKIFSQWLEDYAYLLIMNVRGHPYVLAENKKAFPIFSNKMLSVRKISIPTYIDEKSIGIKSNNELPLDVTLDLYVQ